VTPVPGLYVLGQRFQHRRDSNFIDGVRHDAAYVARHLAGAPTRRRGDGFPPLTWKTVTSAWRGGRGGPGARGGQGEARWLRGGGRGCCEGGRARCERSTSPAWCRAPVPTTCSPPSPISSVSPSCVTTCVRSASMSRTVSGSRRGR